MIVKTIEFGDKDLKKALAAHFGIKESQITFHYISNFMSKRHQLKYRDDLK